MYLSLISNQLTTLTPHCGWLWISCRIVYCAVCLCVVHDDLVCSKHMTACLCLCLPAHVRQYCPYLQRAIQLAQGQGCWPDEEHAPGYRVRARRDDLQRDASSLWGHQVWQELGGHPRSVNSSSTCLFQYFVVRLFLFISFSGIWTTVIRNLINRDVADCCQFL